jgi:RNA polymerase sigma-70 factor, ECF subfamily
LEITERSEARELDDLTLTRAQQGDASAFQVLVETYQGAVFALLWRFFGVGHRDVVEDVAQDSFLGVYRSLARFRPDGAARLSTWILTIATRTALNHQRG